MLTTARLATAMLTTAMFTTNPNPNPNPNPKPNQASATWGQPLSKVPRREEGGKPRTPRWPLQPLRMQQLGG